MTAVTTTAFVQRASLRHGKLAEVDEVDAGVRHVHRIGDNGGPFAGSFRPYTLKIFTTMTTNVGTLDRVVRIALAIVFSILYFTKTVDGTVGIVLLVLGGIFLLTAVVGTCGLYSLFGISTCPMKK